MDSPGCMVIDVMVMRSRIDPSDEHARRTRDYLDEILRSCRYDVVLSKRLEKHYKGKLHPFLEQYDKFKNDLGSEKLWGRSKIKPVQKSLIDARPLSDDERRRIRADAGEDMLLFEHARAAGAAFIITREPDLHRLRIDGIKAVTVGEARECIVGDTPNPGSTASTLGTR